jgi:hypothetical protein
MNAPVEKPNERREAETEAESPRTAEIRKIIEEYADNLREVIKTAGASIEGPLQLGGGRNDHVR